MRSRKRKRFFTGLYVSACIGLLLCIALWFDLFSGLQIRSTDYFFKVGSIDKHSDSVERIVIVGIDDKSLDKLGQISSWPRSDHAKLIDILNEADARVIAFDVLFAESTSDDECLAASMRNAGNVILPVVYTYKANANMGAGGLKGTGMCIMPLGIFEDNAAALGHANVFPDGDGVVRRLPIILGSGGNNEPSLALATTSEYLNNPQASEYPINNDTLSFLGRSIPLDNNHGMIINYVAGSLAIDKPTIFEEVSYVDVLRGEVDPLIFKDKIVLVGATAVGIGDVFWTPTGEMMNGIEIHANAIQTILSANFLKPLDRGITGLSVLLLALFSGLITLRLKVRWAIGSTVLIFAIYLFFAFTCFDNGIMMNMIYPPVAIVGSFMGICIYNYASERSEKNRITQTFGRYISTPVVNKILSAVENDELKLGGEQSEVTVAFADIRGFTGMSENTQPQELVRILNIYLSIVIDSVLKYDGMVNKFGGDSIMAVWNAPTRCEKHALMAVKAAMDAQNIIEMLHYKDTSLPQIDFGIGVNTGLAIAGNLGSESRSEYSVIGDAVNIAARLTSAAKGGKIWIGAGTYDLVKSNVQVKALAPLELKGKSELIQAYEVLDFMETIEL